MIVGIGVDVVAVERIRRLRRKGEERFCRRVFTEGELAACLGKADPDLSLAARFAAKEAGMKALGTGWGAGIGWQDLEVAGSGGRPPELYLHGEAAARASELGAERFHLSLSHDGAVAAAFVVLEGRCREGSP